MPLVPPTRPRGKNVPRVLMRLLWHLATGRRDSLCAVADDLFAGMTPPPRVLGVDLVPREAPFVAIFNHYESEQVAAWWGPFLMSHAITGHRYKSRLAAGPAHPLAPGLHDLAGNGLLEPHWLIASEWWYPGGVGRAVKQPLTRWLFARLSQIYGLVRVPPVLSGDLTRGKGVAGIRRALALTRGDHPQLVGLAPEGHTGPRGALREPPPGVGLFLLLLTHGTLPCLPIGWYEEDRVIIIQFGAPFQLGVPPQAREARDRAAATRAMTAIGRLLPERLWGAYAQDLCL